MSPTEILPWHTAWITGASSGIGRELAVRLAHAGCEVAVSARSADRLAALAAEHPRIIPVAYDVRDTVAADGAFANVVERFGVPELVVLNAGIGVFKSASRFDAALFRTAFETNVIGMGNALAAVVPAFVTRGSGHIALMGSLAGYRGFPRAVHYAPTKAAIRSMADCLRFDLEGKGITVTVINPGYIETPLTAANDAPMPGLMPLAPAVDRIVKGLAAKRYEIAFPWHMALAVKLGAKVSNRAYFAFTRLISG
ncbi:MAG: SDR family NAD(P)-dependent oxidoreductase [Hyphomicrobiaceae bacterium]